MYVITTVTQKGQVTIPKKMRDNLGIDLRKKVKVENKKGYIKVTPTYDLLDIAGTITPRVNKNRSALEAREHMETHYKRA